MRENKGWRKQINENLNKFCLSNDIEEIRNKSMTKWKRELAEKSNIFNTDLMKQMCVEKKNGGLSVKRKTKFVLDEINLNIARDNIINLGSKSIKALIMGRAQMLWCTNMGMLFSDLESGLLFLHIFQENRNLNLRQDCA